MQNIAGDWKLYRLVLILFFAFAFYPTLIQGKTTAKKKLTVSFTTNSRVQTALLTLQCYFNKVYTMTVLN